MNKYRWDAEDYANYSKSQQIWGRELIDKLQLNGNEHILDIGCGDGKITAEIAGELPNGYIIGIDNSEEMIRLAFETYLNKSYPNLEFKLLDAHDLDFYEKFDVVFSNAVLHWIEDHESILTRLYQSLKPHGRVLLQMGGKGNASDILDVLSEIIQKDPWKIYFENFANPYYFYSPEDYEGWIRHTGFTKSRIELLPKLMEHENRQEFEGWIRTTWLPYLKQIPKNQRNRFISDLTDDYLKTYPAQENGVIEVKMIRLEVDLLKSELLSLQE
jgi:trans-aconitate methyltransferase